MSTYSRQSSTSLDSVDSKVENRRRKRSFDEMNDNEIARMEQNMTNEELDEFMDNQLKGIKQENAREHLITTRASDRCYTIAIPFAEKPLYVRMTYPPTQRDLEAIRRVCGRTFANQLRDKKMFNAVCDKYEHRGSGFRGWLLVTHAFRRSREYDERRRRQQLGERRPVQHVQQVKDEYDEEDRKMDVKRRKIEEREEKKETKEELYERLRKECEEIIRAQEEDNGRTCHPNLFHSDAREEFFEDYLHANGYYN